MAKEIVIDIIDGGVSVSSVVQTGDTVAVIKAENLPEEWLSDSTYVYALISQGENQVLNLMQNATENSKTVKKCSVQSVFTANNKAFKIVIFGTNVEVGEDGKVSGSYRYVSAPVMVSVGEGLESLTAEILPDKNGYEAISSLLISLRSAVEAEKVRVANEGKREEAEEARAGAEEIRASAELERAKAEVERAEAESRRIESESTRADNEGLRIDNEGQRLQNEETRMENETERETAETARAAAELGRSAMIESRYFNSYDALYDFMDSVKNNGLKIYKISYGDTVEEPKSIEWLICSFYEDPNGPYSQTLITGSGILTRQFIEWDNDEHIQKWSVWRTIVDDSRLESRLERFADEFTVDVDQSYNANSENAQSGRAVAEAVAEIVNGSPEALDTLYELAKALGNDENFSTTVMEEIGKKANSEYVSEMFDKIIVTGDLIVEKAFRDGMGNIFSQYYATKAEIPTVDSTLNGDSTNPVQNKVINYAIAYINAYINAIIYGYGPGNEDYDIPAISVYMAEHDAMSNVIHETYATKEAVTTQIGDIETSLENIIDKYGLGGETA